jgi:hypothetical protein
VSAIDYSGTQVRGLAGLLVRLRTARPAPTIRAAAIAPAAPPAQAGDDAEVSKHIYSSKNVVEDKVGGETTALNWREDTSAKGWAPADEQIRVPVERPEPGEQTRVINAYGVERALATEVLEEPLLFNLLASELGYPAYDPPVDPADLVAAARQDDHTGDLVRLPVARPAHLGDA